MPLTTCVVDKAHDCKLRTKNMTTMMMTMMMSLILTDWNFQNYMNSADDREDGTRWMKNKEKEVDDDERKY